MTVFVLQHVPFEGPGAVVSWARLRGNPCFVHRLYLGDDLPAAGPDDLLVVMGGPMSANDDRIYAWMAPEKAAIATHISVGGRVIGICLGAQILAAVLGARVYPQPEPEIGWFPISTASPKNRLFAHVRSPMPVLHWHADTFDLPTGAVQLARSEVCEHQAFAVGTRAVGLQFHIEMDYQGVLDITSACASDTARQSRWIQDVSQIRRGASNVALCRGVLYRLLDQLVA
jgi:GMP synthase-like glutamine amidotransferase